MDEITKRTINVAPIKVGSMKRKLQGIKKVTAIIAACSWIYSANSYADFVTTVERTNNVTLTGFNNGDVFTVENKEDKAPISFGVSGTWDYTWFNNSGQEQHIPLFAAFSAGTVQADIFSENKDISTVMVPSNSADSASNTHEALNQPFAGSVQTSLPIGSYLVFASLPGGGSDAGRLEVALVPEPETYAMMLAGLGVLAWRLGDSRT